MLTPTSIAVILGASGLLVSLATLYLSHIRGPAITARLLAPPIGWSTSYVGSSLRSYSAPVTTADFGQVTGRLSIVFSNDGPKGGAVWNLRLRTSDLADPLKLLDPLDPQELPSTVTLSGYSTESIELTVALAWHMRDVENVVRIVTDPAGAFTLRLTYRRRSWMHDTTHQARLTVHWRDVWDCLNNSTSGLAELTIRPDIDRSIRDLAGTFGLSQDEADVVRDALWYTLWKPGNSLDSRVEPGQDGPHLCLVQNPRREVSGSRDSETLTRMLEDYQALLDRVRVLRDERASKLGISRPLEI